MAGEIWIVYEAKAGHEPAFVEAPVTFCHSPTSDEPGVFAE